MKIFIGLLIATTILVTEGCITTSEVIRQNHSVPAHFSTSAFNASFRNNDTLSEGLTLWKALYECVHFKMDTTKLSEAALVKLAFDGSEKLLVTLSDKSRLIKTLELNVKQEGDYLSVRRHLLFIPVPVFFFVFRETKVVLSVDVTGNLSLNYANRGFIWILSTGGGKEQFNRNYIKVGQ